MKLQAGIFLITFLACRTAFGASALVSENYDSHGTFRLGALSFSNTDGETKKTGGASVLNYEYSRFFKMNQALVLGFRQATDSTTKRDAYHSAYGGYRIFPLGVGLPVTSTTGDATIAIDARFKPYAEASLGLGRTLFEPFSEGAGEFASDTMGITLGGGLMMHFFTRWAVDVQLLYEIVQSRGGTGNALAVSGSNMYFLLGSGLLF